MLAIACSKAAKPYLADNGNRNRKDLYGFPNMLETNADEVEYKGRRACSKNLVYFRQKHSCKPSHQRL